MRVRRLGMFERVCVASNKYLAKHGTPHTPEDLKKHDCLIYTLLTTGATGDFRISMFLFLVGSGSIHRKQYRNLSMQGLGSHRARNGCSRRDWKMATYNYY